MQMYADSGKGKLFIFQQSEPLLVVVMGWSSQCAHTKANTCTAERTHVPVRSPGTWPHGPLEAPSSHGSCCFGMRKIEIWRDWRDSITPFCLRAAQAQGSCPDASIVLCPLRLAQVLPGLPFLGRNTEAAQMCVSPPHLSLHSSPQSTGSGWNTAAAPSPAPGCHCCDPAATAGLVCISFWLQCSPSSSPLRRSMLMLSAVLLILEKYY